MKNIIIGQLLLWLNVATIIAGWKLYEYMNPPEAVQVLMIIVGVGGTISNLVFSIAIQGKAYSDLKMVNFN